MYLGIIILFIGLLLMTAKKGFKLKIDRWVLLMMVTGAIYAAAVLLEKHLLHNVNPYHLYSAILIGSFLGYSPFIFFKKSIIKEGFRKRNFSFKTLLLSEFFGIAAMLFNILALSLGLATLVTVLISFQHLFLLIITILISLLYPAIIKEDLKSQVIGMKLVAIISIIIGIYLISP